MIEKIEKLLKSSNREDQIIGVTLAYSNLGKEWCQDNLTGDGSKGRFPSHHKLVLLFDTCDIVLGSYYIEYLDEGCSDFAILDLKTKTNDKHKTTSES